MHNENVKELPGIEYQKDSMYKVCSWTVFKKYMKKKIESCESLETLCKLRDAESKDKDEL